ncbi:hypothetical protein ACO0QE_003366 [Hanseniaspora vineae]
MNNNNSLEEQNIQNTELQRLSQDGIPWQEYLPDQKNQLSITNSCTENTLSAEKSNGLGMDDFLDDEIFYPEGGLKAYLVVAGCFFGLIPVFGTPNTMSVLETYIAENQLANNNASSIAWIFSIFSLLMCSSSILSGFYFDFKGCRDLMIIGTLLHFASLMLVSICTELWHFILCFSIVNGLAAGFLMSPLVSCPSHYFNRKRGNAIAISTIGGSLGGIIYPLILKPFFNTHQYKWGVRTWAFIDLFLLIISTCLVKERFRAVDQDFHIDIKQAVDFKSFLNKNYLFCVIGVVLAEMSITSSLTFFGSYCTKVGISLNDSYNMITVINAMGIPGRWIPGYLGDKIGRYNMAIATLTMLSIVSLVGWLPFGNQGLSAMYVISAFYGFSSGSIFSLLPVCCGQISKTKDFGKRYSTMYFVVAFGTLVAIPISGAIIGPEKKYHGYQSFIIFCSVLSVLSVFSFYISRYYSIKTLKMNVIF